ncbi:DUF11 domain-containing protein [Anaeropeptidivorans aminofermentans]|jgi:uncharacterized repeat protein (TIGR01451 family)|uniref:DUF11 domain-containing protein n=1 Tax=Anaeropeptidivorans aminofermentans TaxID=2934315 RepID=UPI0020257A53|nr:DUF11 domain-containing protein [Anaeropeptidivorans aminofermentans]MBE6013254.1 DUF11 domain-containing protein [Lachnospiraceae bacterium]
MVYKNIENTVSFTSAAGVYLGNDEVLVALESTEYTFEKTADPEIWSGEGQLSYTITLTNVSGDDLTDITVTDVLPSDVTFLPATVEINGATSTNFDDSGLPTVEFGTVTPLSVTSLEPLVITFQVEKTP